MASTLQHIGFVGAGRMATALARGWLRSGHTTASQLVAYDPVAAAAHAFAESTGATLAENNRSVVERSQVVLLCVKPQHTDSVLAELRPALTAQHLVISVVAGVSLARLREALGDAPRLVRVMPNTPALIGQGASAYAWDQHATAADGELTGQLFAAVGQAHAVDEKLLDAVTGLSGSGPAYVFVLLEALADGGVRCGLPRALAQSLAAQTVLGAAQLALQSGEHPAALKDQVASPGGTTIAGLTALEQAGFRAALIHAVEAATRRSAELGEAKK